jgi:hypothetical protein
VNQADGSAAGDQRGYAKNQAAIRLAKELIAFSAATSHAKQAALARIRGFWTDLRSEKDSMAERGEFELPVRFVNSQTTASG